MRGKGKFNLARIIRPAVGASLLFILIIISGYFATHWRRQPDVPLKAKEITQQKIERKEEIQYEEFTGERWNFQVKAQKHYKGEDENYYLEGKVEIQDFGKKGGQNVLISGDKVVYDKEGNHFVLLGQAKVKYEDMIVESDFLEYDKNEAIFKSDKGISLSSKTFKGFSEKIIYWLKQDELLLQEKIELELRPKLQTARPLKAKGKNFSYRRKERKGTMEGEVDLLQGKNHSAASFLRFELSENEEDIRSLFLQGKVKAQLVDEGEGGQEREIEADEISLKAFLDLAQVQAVEAKGHCSLKFMSPTLRFTQVQAESMNFIFDRDGALTEFQCFNNVRMRERKKESEEERFVSGEEMVIKAKPNILRVKGNESLGARVAAKESEIVAEEITLFLRSDNLEARGQVKAVFNPRSAEEQSVGPFSKEQSVFVTAQEMRYLKEKKRFFFNGNIRMWQEKEMLLAGAALVSEETAKIFCEGGVKSIFFHKPKEGQKEERIEISANSMSFYPEENLIFYEESSSLKTRNVNLSAETISVYLEENKGKMKMILARGGVVISQDLQEGRGEEAKYDVGEETIILSGNPVFAAKDKGEIRGDKLTFYIADGRIVVENKERKRSVTSIKS